MIYGHCILDSKQRKRDKAMSNFVRGWNAESRWINTDKLESPTFEVGKDYHAGGFGKVHWMGWRKPHQAIWSMDSTIMVCMLMRCYGETSVSDFYTSGAVKCLARFDIMEELYNFASQMARKLDTGLKLDGADIPHIWTETIEAREASPHNRERLENTRPFSVNGWGEHYASNVAASLYRSRRHELSVKLENSVKPATYMNLVAALFADPVSAARTAMHSRDLIHGWEDVATDFDKAIYSRI